MSMRVVQLFKQPCHDICAEYDHAHLAVTEALQEDQHYFSAGLALDLNLAFHYSLIKVGLFLKERDSVSASSEQKRVYMEDKMKSHSCFQVLDISFFHSSDPLPA